MLVYLIAATLLQASTGAKPPPDLAEPRLTEVFFDAQSSKVDKAARLALKAIVGSIKLYAPTCAIRIVGHADDYLQEREAGLISQRRAQVIKDYVTRRVAPATDIHIEAVADRQPFVDRHGLVAEPQNRRVEILPTQPCR